MNPDRLSTEIAHLLFMDLVAYSRLSMEQQAKMAAELRAVLRGTPEFQRAEAQGELIPLDLGDGMALVFFRDPIAPVQCAVEIARAAEGHPELRLRMGVHSGPVSRATDINGKENVTGSGINTAQRVMDCGDAGHILLSHTCAEVLKQFESWSAAVHDLGECEVKHGERIHLFNLHVEEIGNPAVPSKIDRQSTTAISSTFKTEDSVVGSSGLSVAILYKRNSPADEYVMHHLEHELAGRGHTMFVDRHMSIGVEWASEIERKVRTADAVVALVSESAQYSEMLEFEVCTAHEANLSQNGKPRILPVRVHFTGAVREPLASVLNPLQYTVWSGSDDDARVVAELDKSLRNPPQTRPSPRSIQPVGGAIPLDSEFYIERPTDHDFTDAIARRDSIVLVKGARQMGKTSLLARGLHLARESAAKVALTDFQTLNVAHLESPDALYRILAETLADQLDLEVMPDEVWNPTRGANMNLERYIRREVLGAFEEPLVWGMDEVDRLFTCSFGSEVFGLFRSWHNRRSLDPSGPWSRLTLAIAYATEAHLFITDLNQSPFNVGTRLALGDFNEEQVADLNRRYGSPLQSPKEVARFHELLNGQPYLVNRGLAEMVARGIDIAALEAQADRDEGVFGDHLRRILVSLSQDPEMLEVVRGILKGAPCQNLESFYRLRSGGVMSGDSAADVKPRCLLYRRFLERHLL